MARPLQILARFALVAALGLAPGAVRGAAAPAPARATAVRLRAVPLAVATAAGAVWVVVETARDGAALWRVDARTGRRTGAYQIGPAGPDLGAVAVAGGVVWAAAGEHAIRVDATPGGRVVRVRIPGVATALSAGFGSVWIASIGSRRDLLVSLDATTLARRAAIAVDEPAAILATGGAVWIAETSSLDRVDPRTDRLTPTFASVSQPTALAPRGDGVWVVEGGTALAVDGSGRPARRLLLPFAAGAFSATAGRLWVTSNCGCPDGKAALLDPRTGRTRHEWRVGETPIAIAAAGSTAWVATFGDRTLWRLSAG